MLCSDIFRLAVARPGALPGLHSVVVPVAATAVLALAGPAGAQAVATAPAADGAVERRIERIRIDERAVTVEELRHGGETQSIQVMPRDMPAYEIQPTDGARSRQFARDGLSEAKGARVWNLLRF